MALLTDYGRRTALCEWLTANGIEPRNVPVDGDLTIHDTTDGGRVIRCEVFTRSPEGAMTLDERGTSQAREIRTVPLVVEPPVWFEPYVKPTREQLLGAVERVRALHHDWDKDPGHCVHCVRADGGLVLWPCPTLRELDGEQP